MFTLDETTRYNIIKDAHEVARQDLMENLEFEDMTGLNIEHACSMYKSSFLDALTEGFDLVKSEMEDVLPFMKMRLAERLAEKGIIEYAVTTPPVCLTVSYKGVEMSFTYDSDSAIAVIDGFEAEIACWDEDIIELFDAIHTETDDSNIFSHVRRAMDEYMTEKVQRDIMISSAQGVIRAKLADVEYEIVNTIVTGNQIKVEVLISGQKLSLEGTLENFADIVEHRIIELKKRYRNE